MFHYLRAIKQVEDESPAKKRKKKHETVPDPEDTTEDMVEDDKTVRNLQQKDEGILNKTECHSIKSKDNQENATIILDDDDDNDDTAFRSPKFVPRRTEPPEFQHIVLKDDVNDDIALNQSEDIETMDKSSVIKDEQIDLISDKTEVCKGVPRKSFCSRVVKVKKRDNKSKHHTEGGVEKSSKKWECGWCTYLNHLSLKLCEMCNNPCGSVPKYVMEMDYAGTPGQSNTQKKNLTDLPLVDYNMVKGYTPKGSKVNNNYKCESSSSKVIMSELCGGRNTTPHTRQVGESFDVLCNSSLKKSQMEDESLSDYDINTDTEVELTETQEELETTRDKGSNDLITDTEKCSQDDMICSNETDSLGKCSLDDYVDDDVDIDDFSVSSPEYQPPNEETFDINSDSESNDLELPPLMKRKQQNKKSTTEFPSTPTSITPSSVTTPISLMEGDIDRIIMEESAAVKKLFSPKVSKEFIDNLTEWTCPDCDTKNSAEDCDCDGCFKPKPKDIIEDVKRWTCSNCTNVNIDISKDCEECFAPRMVSTEWKCTDCGTINNPEDPDCDGCFKPRPKLGNDSRCNYALLL